MLQAKNKNKKKGEVVNNEPVGLTIAWLSAILGVLMGAIGAKMALEKV